MMVDGFDNNHLGTGAVAAPFSQEVVREFQVLAASFPAEFGDASGGIVNTVTKSGTNVRQGSAYFFVRDAALNAKGYFEKNDVYAIAIDSPDRQPINTRVNPAALREITAQSGGRTEIVESSAQLAGAAASIAEELNSQYVLGYTPPRGADGQFHSLRVRIAGSNDRARARHGYVATPPRKPSAY